MDRKKMELGMQRFPQSPQLLISKFSLGTNIERLIQIEAATSSESMCFLTMTLNEVNILLRSSQVE
jgi:hypothetical protein